MENSPKIKETLKNIDWDAFAADVVRQLKAEKEQEDAYFNSDRFKQVYNTILEYLKAEKHLCDDEYSDPYLLSDITNREYLLAFSCMWDRGTDYSERHDDEYPFPTEFKLYADFCLQATHGQGTLHVMSLKHV